MRFDISKVGLEEVSSVEVRQINGGSVAGVLAIILLFDIFIISCFELFEFSNK